jgi:hypothetical protein
VFKRIRSLTECMASARLDALVCQPLSIKFRGIVPCQSGQLRRLRIAMFSKIFRREVGRGRSLQNLLVQTWVPSWLHLLGPDG